jgi:hypothetical protein
MYVICMCKTFNVVIFFAPLLSFDFDPGDA